MRPRLDSRWFCALIVCLLTACGTPPAPSPDSETTDTETMDADTASAGMAMGTAGMVSAAHPLATAAGLEILERGGNAFDAAVAVAATLNVVEPNMSGIGGYGTILVHQAESGSTRFLNASGRIPRAVDSDVFRAPTPGWEENRRGAKGISTPGNANAWQALNDLGKLPREDLYAPAIRIAEEGFPVSPRLAYHLGRAFDDFPEEARAIYGKDGNPLAEGDLLVQEDLAATLRALAKDGARVVHGGAVGQAIDAAMKEAGGFLSLADLEENEAEWYEPIKIDYRGYEVATAPPPATAFPSLVRLGLMSRFDLVSLGHNSPEYLHLFAEVTKHAFWTRLAWAGDPEVEPPPLDLLLSEPYWEEQAAALDRERASELVPPAGRGGAAGMNTTHFVTADRWGNVVSATQTLGNSFGSRILVPGTGVWLNNSLAYCTFEPKGNPMDAHAGHHKLSGDCPTIVFKDGRPWVALGTPGGHTIGQTVPQMVINLVDFKMDVYHAIAAPRVSFIEPDFLAVEGGLPEDVRDALAARGHKIDVWDWLGNAHALTIEYGPDGRPVKFEGAADPRGEGEARGL